MIYYFLWDVFEVLTDVFKILQRGAVVKILDVSRNEFCIWSGDDGICKGFESCKTGGVSCGIAGVGEIVATCS